MAMQKKFLFLILLSALVFVPHAAKGAQANLNVSPAQKTASVGTVFPVSVNVNPAGQQVCVVSGVLNLTNLFCKSITVASGLMAQTVPSCADPTFVIGIPKCTTVAQAILSVKVGGAQPGDASLSVANAKLIGSGVDVPATSLGADYEITSIEPSVSCSASPSNAMIGQDVAFKAVAFGGSGKYTYSWSGDCVGKSSACSAKFDSSGTKKAKITITSEGKSVSATCSATIGAPSLSVTCSSSVDLSGNIAGLGQKVDFNATVLGGDGKYVYSWSNDCTGSEQSCSASFDSQGIKKATVTVTSSGKSASADCLLAAANLMPKTYSVCSSDKKCVSVVGEGQSTCQSDTDCKDIFVLPSFFQLSFSVTMILVVLELICVIAIIICIILILKKHRHEEKLP